MSYLVFTAILAAATIAIVISNIFLKRLHTEAAKQAAYSEMMYPKINRLLKCEQDQIMDDWQKKLNASMRRFVDRLP